MPLLFCLSNFAKKFAPPQPKIERLFAFPLKHLSPSEMSSVSSCLKPLCAGTTTQNWCDDCMKDGDKSQHASYPFTAPREEKEPEAQTAKKEDVLKAALDTSLEVAKRNQEMYYREVKQHAKTQKALEAALEASSSY